MDRRFVDRTAVVTGASTGIGEATARRFAAEGARVVLAAKRLTKPLLDRIGRQHKRQYLKRKGQDRSHTGHVPTARP